MSDPFYPCVAFDFLNKLILHSDKIIPEQTVNVGNTTTYMLKGEFKAMHKRLLLVRTVNPNEVCLEIATGIALRLNFLGTLMEWLEVNKGWKEGGYTLGSQQP